MARNRVNCILLFHKIFIILYCILIIVCGVLIFTVGTLFNFSPSHKKSIREHFGLDDTEDPELASYSDSYGPIFYFVLLAFSGLFVVIFGVLGILAVCYGQKKLLYIYQFVNTVCFIPLLLRSIRKSTQTLVFSSSSLLVLITLALAIRSAYYIIRNVDRSSESSMRRAKFFQHSQCIIESNGECNNINY
jgi:hypothetical protein